MDSFQLGTINHSYGTNHWLVAPIHHYDYVSLPEN